MIDRKIRKIRKFLPLLLICFFVMECVFFVSQLEMYKNEMHFRPLEMLRCGVYQAGSRNLTLHGACSNCTVISTCKNCTESSQCKNCTEISPCKKCSDIVIKHKIFGPGTWLFSIVNYWCVSSHLRQKQKCCKMIRFLSVV